MRWIFLAAVALGLGGCLHAPADYPGASGSSIDPSQYVNAKCPDFSGTYQAVGVLMDGDATAQRFERIEFFDSVFPSRDPNEWNALQKHYRRGERSYVRPDFSDVKQLSDRSVLVTIRYSDAIVGSYHSDYSNTSRFVCVDGKLMWGNGNGVSSYAEYGWNTGDRSFVIYLDKNNDLISEERQQVHMNFGFIPAGTAKYFSIYKFKRISPQPGYKE